MTARKRWPDGAEAQRVLAKERAGHARELIKEAVALIQQRRDFTLAELKLAYADSELADIERGLTEAKIGL